MNLCRPTDIDMAYGAISSSKLTAFNRMDAGFHLANQKLEADGRLAKTEKAALEMASESGIEMTLTNAKQQALTFVMSLDHRYQREATANLVRGNNDSCYAIQAAMKEYPIHTMAIAMSELNVLDEAISQAEEANNRLKKIQSVAKKIGNSLPVKKGNQDNGN